MYNIDYDNNFTINFKNLINKINNEIGVKYLDKPNMYIKYVFIILKEVKYATSFYTQSMQLDYSKDKIQKIYVPAIFNFRELKGKHKSILEKIQYHIDNTLPIMYDINTTVENIFYSNYKYGEIFYIKTEYLYTLSNIFNYSYKYKTTITLQEIIYMLSIIENEKNLSDLRIDYLIKKNELKLPTKKLSKKSVKKIQFYSNETSETNKSSESNENSENQIILKCNKHNKNNSNENINKKLNLIFNSVSTKIITLFQETGFYYNIIYKNEDKFYYIKIQSNLCNIDLETLFKIKSEANSIYMCNEIKQYIINTLDLNIFKIIKHKIIEKNDFNEILKLNPLIIININKNPNFNNLNIINKIFINRTETFLVPNFYIKKPIYLCNILDTELYKREFKYFKDNFNIKLEHETKTYDIINPINKDTIFILNKSNFVKINKIYFNKNNCNYNFIELKELIGNPLDNYTKLIVWVVPFNATVDTDDINDSFKGFDNNPNTIKPTYVGNFTDLNNNHLQMLNEIKNLYNKYNICDINMQSIYPLYNCFHFHIFNNNLYKDLFSLNELGSRLIGQLSITTIINNINWKNNYYNDFDIQKIR